MKSRTSSHENGNGNGSSHDPVAKAATTARIAQVARKHFKMLKAEYKQARKAYRQAKKAAKHARKEADELAEMLKAKPVNARPKAVKKVVKRAQPVQRKTQTATAIPLPAPATASASTPTA